MTTKTKRLEKAKHLCQAKGADLTELRSEVLELIYASDTPLRAYDLLRKLRELRPKAEPPTIYRALEFLQKQHLIHRIESDNAYVACDKPESSHSGLFLLCQQCGLAIELDDKKITHIINHYAEEKHFKIIKHTTEIIGLCTRCA